MPPEIIDACVIRGRIELPPQDGCSYTAALDAAFKSDNFAFAIVHKAGEKVVEDVIRCWRGTKLSPVLLSRVLEEITETLRRYGVMKIHGDQFCSEPIRQALKERAVTYVQTTTLGSRAAQVWASFRTLAMSGQIELLDSAETIGELKRLELVMTSGGGQRVEAASGHDDRAVALAVAAHQAVAVPQRQAWCESIFIHPDRGAFDRSGSWDEDGFLWRRIG